MGPGLNKILKRHWGTRQGNSGTSTGSRSMSVYMESRSLHRSEEEMVVVSWAKLLASPVVTFRSEFLESVVLAGITNTVWQVEYVRVMEDNPSKDVSYEHGSLYYRERLCVPESDSPDFRCQISEAEHDSKIEGHMGMGKTVEIIKRNLFWPQINSYMEDHVRSCDSCQGNKGGRHPDYGLIHPLEPA